jgi:hypothetical protein
MYFTPFGSSGFHLFRGGRGGDDGKSLAFIERMPGFFFGRGVEGSYNHSGVEKKKQ